MPRATVVALAGRIRPESWIRRVERSWSSLGSGPGLASAPIDDQVVQQRVGLAVREVEQTHLALGFRLFGRDDPRRFALKVLSVVLWENMSSRLFQVIRERHGLAYAIQSAVSHFADTGSFVITAGVEPADLRRTLGLILRELRKMADQPVGCRELRRAQDYLTGQIRLGLESSGRRMNWAGETVMSYGRIVTPEAVIDRWRQNGTLAPSVDNPCPPAASLVAAPPKLRALVGQSASGTIHLDLRAQGPHALVGGTTGSGKSEFLQSLVAGLAASHPPTRISFVLVDYKGGAAFKACKDLPHTVGFVTDLNEHLVHRALVSLNAEVTRREHILSAHRAKDLIDLEEKAPAAAPASLAIVIDEFAALAKEVPEFVDGVIDIAARGRSLGMHLVLATQRPAGVVTDSIRANTNLRVALRVTSEAESVDVIGSRAAAAIEGSAPGRAFVQLGRQDPLLFQSAFAGTQTLAGRKPPPRSARHWPGMYPAGRYTGTRPRPRQRFDCA